MGGHRVSRRIKTNRTIVAAKQNKNKQKTLYKKESHYSLPSKSLITSPFPLPTFSSTPLPPFFGTQSTRKVDSEIKRIEIGSLHFPRLAVLANFKRDPFALGSLPFFWVMIPCQREMIHRQRAVMGRFLFQFCQKSFRGRSLGSRRRDICSDARNIPVFSGRE